MTLADEAKAHLDALGVANRAFMQNYPGDRASRQPVHTVYGGAHLFAADTAQRLGELAQQSLATYGGDAFEFAHAVGFVPEGAIDAGRAHALQAAFERDPNALRTSEPLAWLALTVYQRVQAK